MDNLLIQVTGSKKVVLFSPDQAEKLYLEGKPTFLCFSLSFFNLTNGDSKKASGIVKVHLPLM
jgi:hypothetical protein